MRVFNNPYLCIEYVILIQLPMTHQGQLYIPQMTY